MSDRVESLVERESELATAASALDLIAAGGGRTLLIEGPAGIGKSAVIRAVGELAALRGMRSPTARGSELEIEFPYGVVRQLFESQFADAATRERALAGAAGPAASVFSTEVTSAGGADDVSFSTLHGLYWMTLNLAGDDPLLLFVDDIHWCDRPSLRFLSYLSHRLDGAPIGLVAGLRSTDPGTDPALIADIVGGPEVISVRPGPLSDAAIGHVVEARLGSEADGAFNGAVGVATGGNPLLVRQLLSELALEGASPTERDAGMIADVGPRAVTRTVLRRLGRLEPEASEVARALAILGDGSDVDAIATFCGYGREQVAAAITSLVRAEIVAPGTEITFVHPLVRDALYEERLLGERQLHHAKAARQMLERGDSAERIAAQLLAADPVGEEWASETLERAATDAASKGAMESASTYLERVLREPLDPDRRARLQFGLGLAEVAFDGPRAAAHLQEAHEGLTDPASKAIAAYALARTMLFIEEEQRAVDFAATEVPRVSAEFPDTAKMLESIELMGLYFGARVDRAAERFAALRRLPPDDSPGEAMLTSVSAFDWMMRGGPVGECVELAEAALESPTLMEYDNGLFWTASNIVLVVADQPRALEVWDSALSASHRRGSMFGALTVHLWRGWTKLRYGDLNEAEESLRLGLEQCKLWGLRVGTYARGFLAELLVEQGRLDEADRILSEEESVAGAGEGAQCWRKGEVELLLARGRAEEALERSRSLIELDGWRSSPAFSDRRSLEARSLILLGLRDEAIALLETDLTHAESWEAPGTVGRSLRLLAEARGDQGIADLERAIELLRKSPMRLDLAKALAALGSALRRGRKPTEAREPLREAFELAEACGAGLLTSRVRTELHASGVRPRSSALSGPASLTPSERRVAELAASGQTNKQIAQELYVTPKTVEVHLSNSYRKLDISGRRELTDALG